LLRVSDWLFSTVSKILCQKEKYLFSKNDSHFSIKKLKNNQINVIEEKILNVMNDLKNDENEIVLSSMSQSLVSNLESNFSTFLIIKIKSILNQNWNILNDLQSFLYFCTAQLSALYSQYSAVFSDAAQFSADKSAKEQYQHYHNDYAMNYAMIF